MSTQLPQEQTGPGLRELSIPGHGFPATRVGFFKGLSSNFAVFLSKGPQAHNVMRQRESQSILVTLVDSSGPLYGHPLLPQRTPPHLTCTRRISATRNRRALPCPRHLHSNQVPPGRCEDSGWDPATNLCRFLFFRFLWLLWWLPEEAEEAAF